MPRSPPHRHPVAAASWPRCRYGRPIPAIQLPSVGTVAELTAAGERQEGDFYCSFTSFLVPPTIFRYDGEARTLVSYNDARLDTDLSIYETTQLFFTSRDGMRIPLFITARRDVVVDGSRPTLLVADGAFGTSMTPVFSSEILAWLDMGGVYAVANVRGGGEYGRAWHEAAMLDDAGHGPLDPAGQPMALRLQVDERHGRIGQGDTLQHRFRFQPRSPFAGLPLVAAGVLGFIMADSAARGQTGGNSEQAIGSPGFSS